MKRLTTDCPAGNFETMLNYVYGEDGWAHIRHDGKDSGVSLTAWAKRQCLARGCGEFLEESEEELDLFLCECLMDCPDCPVALAYCFASQAVHLRSRLKQYEDILFDEDGKERLTLDSLRKLAMSSNPLTLDELREMDGEPVWIAPVKDKGKMPERWMLAADFLPENGIYLFMPDSGMAQGYKAINYGKTWLAYRHRMEAAP